MIGLFEGFERYCFDWEEKRECKGIEKKKKKRFEKIKKKSLHSNLTILWEYSGAKRSYDQ